MSTEYYKKSKIPTCSATELHRNIISTASLIVLRSSNSRAPWQIVLDVTGSRKSKMAAYIPEVLITQLVD